jgi:hypothetical protein
MYGGMVNPAECAAMCDVHDHVRVSLHAWSAALQLALGVFRTAVCRHGVAFACCKPIKTWLVRGLI